jgi:cytoskeletal protein RodZ
MTKHFLPLFTALALSLSLSCASAQSDAASAPAPALTKPKPKPAAKPVPIKQSPTVQTDVNSPPLDKPPGGDVQPQISIPFGKTPPPPKNKLGTARKTGSANGINDGAARCNAEADEQARALCRDKLRGK